MLILTRRIGESIRIGDDVCVTVLEVKGVQVRLGIAAPATVAVHREEVFNRIAHERELSPPAQPALSGHSSQGQSAPGRTNHTRTDQVKPAYDAQKPIASRAKVVVRKAGRKLLSPSIG